MIAVLSIAIGLGVGLFLNDDWTVSTVRPDSSSSLTSTIPSTITPTIPSTISTVKPSSKPTTSSSTTKPTTLSSTTKIRDLLKF